MARFFCCLRHWRHWLRMPLRIFSNSPIGSSAAQLMQILVFSCLLLSGHTRPATPLCPRCRPRTQWQWLARAGGRSLGSLKVPGIDLEQVGIQVEAPVLDAVAGPVAPVSAIVVDTTGAWRIDGNPSQKG